MLTPRPHCSLTVLLALALLSTLLPRAAAESAPTPPPDTSADLLAKLIREKAGLQVGLCELPRAGDGTLAAALVRTGVNLVHGLAPDASAVETARKPALAAGWLGTQIVIETGTPAQLPLADWTADLLVVADATDVNLKELSAKEAARVLSPYRGVAIIGQPLGKKGGLSKSALEAWAVQVSGKAEIKEDSSGLWAVVHMPGLKGGDDWSHFLHGPDGNLVSNDQVFHSTPMQLQWNSGWYGGAWDVHVVAGGRMFTAQCSGNLPREVVARNAYNGEALWRRAIAGDFGLSSSLLAATPDRLYLKDAGSVLILSAETGAELKRVIATTDPVQHCLWLLVSDGVLITLTGPVQEADERTVDNVEPNSPRPQRIIAQQDKLNDLHCGREIVAWDAVTGAELWRHPDEKIDQSKLVVNEGKVFYYARREYAACLELKTGKQLWKTNAPINPKGSGMGYVWNPDGVVVKSMMLGRQGAVATHDVYLISYYPHRQCQAFDATDGHLLWDKSRGAKADAPEAAKVTDDYMRKTSYDFTCGTFGYQVVFGKELVEQNWGRRWDVVSGRELPNRVKIENGGCARFTALSNGMIFGTSGEIYNSNTNRPVIKYNSKSTCGAGQFIGDGLLFKLASGCPACGEWRGNVISRSTPQTPVTPQPNLEKGTAPQPAQAISDASDWPTYRSDGTRKNSSAAAIPATGAILWTFDPKQEGAPEKSALGKGGGYLGWDNVPSQAIAVGERVYIGTASGAVVALDRKTGAEQWRFDTSGRIYSSPTWWQGRVFVGSCDGYVYSLDAATGALLWRYRISPYDRRIMVQGRLSSAWPIEANVLVEDNTVFAAGGLIGQFEGAHFCALDARTGALRWEKHLPGISPANMEDHFTREGDGQNHHFDAKVDVTNPGCGPEELYHTLRLGNDHLTYAFCDLKPNAAYTVRLHFSEPWADGPGVRVTKVTVNDKPGLENFDIFHEAGGKNKAVVREIQATADNGGNLAVQLHSVKNAVIISGVEVLSGKTPVYKVQAGGGGTSGFGPDVDAVHYVPPVPSASGQLAWYQGKVWWKVGDTGIMVLDAATGAMQSCCPRLYGDWWDWGPRRGQDLGILPGGWVTMGGRQFNLPFWEKTQPRHDCGFLHADPAGVPEAESAHPRLLGLGELHEFESLPVWDDQETLLVGKRSNRPVLYKNFGARLTKNDKLADEPEQQHLLFGDNQRYSIKVSSMALAANAVVFISDEYDWWRLVATSRNERHQLWEVKLPNWPVWNGLSLTRTGDVLVPLADGRVLCIGDKAQH